ncbi:YeeE/YedE thiosulfate transporter family protein [Paludibaculum fermentans]|uniref:YeeE/YedE family protein n=1 Tax=Paludibaculum fermentans TaxID=1473598 RepID=A0A7S7NVY8_PALFE|nr:YeeE/YedE thiosulfate transporter family protein [Paludibaculum fermentans]QOY90763.1 YeeE/YedE family protein [Paludibaculum fermentans]
MTESAPRLLLGLFTGFLFGFFLQKGHVAKFRVIAGQFLLRDFTVLKTMLTAIVVGGIGVYALKAMGLATLHVKPAQLVAVTIGGLVFGVGMVLLGYCPGTGVAAAAEGQRDALFGILGMILGSAVFAEFYGIISTSIMKWYDLGPVTIPDLLGVPTWTVLAALTVAALALFHQLDRSR